MSPDWRLLADLTPADLQAALLDQAGAEMTGKSDREEDDLLRTLPEPVRAVWLLDWLDFEVAQGGLLAYFGNSHGRHAALAVGVLHRIGADRMGDVVARAAATSDDRELDQLTDEYWRAADDDDWGSRLDAYLSEQAGLLRRTGHCSC